MSTRSTTHFIYTDSDTGKIETLAIVYRHSDGYPKGAGRDLCQFLTRCKKLQDSRLTDPSYLAARYVVFLAEMFASDYAFQDPQGKLHKHAVDPKKPNEKRKYVTVPRKNRLNFISCGVVMSDPWDIEYRYTVDCSKIDPKTGRPEVKCYKVNIGDDGQDKTRQEVPIPGYTKVVTVVETWDVVRSVVSRSKASKTYNIERNSVTMALRCTCPDFKYRANKNGGYCKHLHSVPLSTRYTPAFGGTTGFDTFLAVGR
jgi:hypothetical protein